MFCCKCGAKVPDDASFCVNCGARLDYKKKCEQSKTQGKYIIKNMKIYYYVLIFILLFFFAIGLCSVSKPAPPKAFSYNEIHNYDHDLVSESVKHELHWGKENGKMKTFLPYLKNYNTGIYFLPCVIIQTNEGTIFNYEKARKDKDKDEQKYAGLEYTPSLGIQAIYYSRKEDNAEPLKFDYIVFNIDGTEYQIDYKSAVQGSNKNDKRYMEWYCYSAREKDINILKEICASHKAFITAYAKDKPSKKITTEVTQSQKDLIVNILSFNDYANQRTEQFFEDKKNDSK